MSSLFELSLTAAVSKESKKKKLIRNPQLRMLIRKNDSEPPAVIRLTQFQTKASKLRALINRGVSSFKNRKWYVKMNAATTFN